MVASARPAPLDPTPRAILFDLDDTLCDYAAAREVRLRVAFSLEGHPETARWSDEELAALIAESIRMHPHGVEHFPELLAKFGVDDPAVAAEAARWYRTNKLYGLQLFDGALQVLKTVRAVKEAGQNGERRPVGIITNGPTDVQREKLDLLGLRDLVDFVVISEEFGAAKPDARIFDEALRLAGVEASEAVFIGDSAEYDMVGAITTGIPTIWINRAQAPWDHEGPRPDRDVRSIAEVPPLVGSA